MLTSNFWPIILIQPVSCGVLCGGSGAPAAALVRRELKAWTWAAQLWRRHARECFSCFVFRLLTFSAFYCQCFSLNAVYLFCKNCASSMWQSTFFSAIARCATTCGGPRRWFASSGASFAKPFKRGTLRLMR